MPVGTNLQNVLGGRQLAGTIQAIKPGLPIDQLPPGLFTPGRTVEGNSCTMYQVSGSRKTAQLAQYGAPSRRRTLSGVTEQPVVLAHFAENIEIKASTLINLESQDGVRQRLGESEVDRLLAETRTIMDNTRIGAVMSAFALTKIYYDADGNLLSSSSGAQITVDMNVPSGNKNQLAVGGGSAIIDASWANPATKIVKQIQKLKLAARKLNGYVPTTALYGSDILDLILNNNQLAEIINRNLAFQSAFSSGEIPDGFLGLKWFPAYNSFFEDATGTNREVFPTNGITFMPDVSPDWYEMIQGTTPIPGMFGDAKPDISAVLADVSMQAGMWAYAYGTVDPVGATMVYGDTFLPYIKVPGSIYTAVVVF